MDININGVGINTILPRKRLPTIHRISLFSIQYQNRCNRNHWYAKPRPHKLLVKRNKLEYESDKLHTYNAICIRTQTYRYQFNAYHTCTNILQGHYRDVIMSVMASQTTGVSIVYSIACSGVDQRKHHSSASLAFVRGIHRSLVNAYIWWRHHDREIEQITRQHTYRLIEKRKNVKQSLRRFFYIWCQGNTKPMANQVPSHTLHIIPMLMIPTSGSESVKWFHGGVMAALINILVPRKDKRHRYS